MSINDKRLYPLYGKAEELQLPVALHTGVNYHRAHHLRHEQPLMIDEVASDFPDLVLVACHAGWPWVTEMIAVARRHPTVYLDFGGMAPRYLTHDGSGWREMFHHMNTLLSEQILFASDWPTMSLRRCVPEWLSLGLRPEVLEASLATNCERLLRRGGAVLPGDELARLGPANQ